MSTEPNIDTVREPLLQCLQSQKDAFLAEGAVTPEVRIDRLDRCIELLVDNRDAIIDALEQDFGNRGRAATLSMELFTSVNTLKNSRKNLKKWMKPEKRRAPFPMGLFGAKAKVHYQPKGVVGVMTPWNVPVNMIFSPLADILAAGNRAMIKPSEFTPVTSELMAQLFGRYFEQQEIAVFTGGAEVGAAFSGLPFDHLIFTGATSIGRMVMRAASENLTPVTLELGGKSPVIVSDSADIKATAEKIMAGKAMNGGQICVSPDYCFVPAAKMEAFVSACRDTVARQFPTLADNPDVTAIINERHRDRIAAYIDEARAADVRIEELNPAKEDWTGEAHCKMPIHLVVEPGDELKCMQDEIFGPILNLKGYTRLDDAVREINSRPRPLALYWFGTDNIERDFVLSNTTAGGMAINDVTMQVGCDDLPFGGVGNSGIGNYHGFDGFRTFSHAKGVFYQGFVSLQKLAGLEPPYTDKAIATLESQIKR